MLWNPRPFIFPGVSLNPNPQIWPLNKSLFISEWKRFFVRFSEFVVILKFMITKLGLQIAKCQMSVPSLPNSMILHVQDFVGQCPMSKTFLDNGQLDIPSETTDWRVTERLYRVGAFDTSTPIELNNCFGNRDWPSFLQVRKSIFRGASVGQDVWSLHLCSFLLHSKLQHFKKRFPTFFVFWHWFAQESRLW